MDQQTQRRPPWTELAFLLVIGIPAFAIALLCGFFVWAYTGPQYDIQIINDHEIGGTFDRVVALVVATSFGAVGIFSVLRLLRRMSIGRQTRSGLSPGATDGLVMSIVRTLGDRQ